MDDYFGKLISALPVTIRRRVQWGECDPAGVVYTPHFSDFVVESGLIFSELMIGSPLRQKLQELGIDLPAKALSLEFSKGLKPEEVFDMRITVGEIRTRSFDLHVEAIRPGGETIFCAKFSPICVHSAVREACAIPATLRTALESYRDQCNVSHVSGSFGTQ